MSVPMPSCSTMRFNAIGQTFGLLSKPFVPGLGPGIHEPLLGLGSVSWVGRRRAGPPARSGERLVDGRAEPGHERKRAALNLISFRGDPMGVRIAQQRVV